MIPNAKRDVGTRPARIQRGGKILYLGRYEDSAARRVEAAARGEHARTGRVKVARSVRQAPGCTIHSEDANLWMWAHFISGRELTGEQQLMLAVVESAKSALLSESRIARTEAERWFRSDERGHLYAFATICDVFDIDPEHARSELFARRNSTQAEEG